MNFKKIILLSLITFPMSAFSSDISVQLYVDETQLAATEQQKSDTIERLDFIVESVNKMFKDSQVDIQIGDYKIKFTQLNYNTVYSHMDITCDFCEGKDIKNSMYDSTGPFQGLRSDADKYGYDYTMLFLKDNGKIKPNGSFSRICGASAKVATTENVGSTYNTILTMDIDCGAAVLAHELGHNMGLSHGSYLERVVNDVNCTKYGDNNPIRLDGRGHTNSDCNGANNSGEFATIMLHNYTGVSNIPLFSNANLQDPLCDNGYCGIAYVGDPNNPPEVDSENIDAGDSARVLNYFSSIYGTIEIPDVDGLNYSSANLLGCLEQTPNTEIVDLAVLNCDDMGIHRLGGIEQLTSLTDLSLAGGSFISVESFVENLPLQTLDLSRSENVMCSELDRLSTKFTVIEPQNCYGEGIVTATIITHVLL
jgi:hypothetical protein